MKSFLSLVVLYCLLMNFATQAVFSQTEQMDTPTPTPTPVDPELQKLKDKNAILEEQKKAADLEKAINDAKFPKSATTPLEGNTELDAGVKIESEMMAYRALKKVSDKVSEDVIAKRGNATTLAILNNQWLTGIRSYWATKNQMNLIEAGYDAILVPVQPPFLVAAQNDSDLLAGIFEKDKIKWTSTANAVVRKSAIGSAINDNLVLANIVAPPNSASSEKSNRSFTGVATTIGSAFGIAGSIVGAFIDVAALMRTDTKIIGSTFAVQESALVSEVYRGLKSKSSYTNLYYPAEFSPNINVQSDFIILKNIQDLYEKKSKAEQLVTEIEEVDKVYKEAVTAKEALEARKKQLPDLIAAAERELKKNEGTFKTPKFRSAELKAKIEDNKNTLADLIKEKDIDLPKKIESNSKAILNLDVRLARLYEKIKTVKPEIDLVGAYIKVARSLDAVSNRLLRRAYKLDELAKLSIGDKDTTDNLTKEAKAIGQLSAIDEDRLIKPIEAERLKIFVKVANHIRGREDLFIHPVLNDMLSDEEQLKLFYPEDEQVAVAKKILEKGKVASVNKLKVLNKQFDKFFEDIVKVDAATAVNPITSHLQTENLLNALGCDMTTGACDNANALVLKVVDVGGNNKVKKNLVTMIATGDDISHSGGAIVEYKMYNLYGNVLTSSVCSAYEPYRKAKNVNISTSAPNNAVCSMEYKTEDEEDEGNLARRKKNKNRANITSVKN